ncbi:hypothetical protein HPB48_011580 [Haemaphysalis longicornis]|uniref:Uncharacterized protein n=1 Tax=Haemaphysalis longicornis TaxID=44386 RepID=A0A9J6FN16_HAELO|nr:hypothetical protein HPB48_011580 [Haemaphysalis longicornis]
MAARTGPPECLLHDFVRAGPCLDPDRLLAMVQGFVNALKTKGVDVFLPCGTTEGASAVQDCWIAYHLRLLNRSLERVGLELREEGPGVMTLTTRFTRKLYSRVGDSLIFDAAFVFYWLLRHHRCVRTVLLGTSAFLCERMPTIVSNAFSGNIAAFRFCPSPRHANLPHAILSGLERMTNLTELYLGEGVDLRGRSTAHLVAVLDAGRLRSLVLEKYPSGKKDARKLLHALSDCSSLTSLHIETGARHMPGAGKLLRSNLRCLCLGEVTGLLVAEVFAALADNDTLEELSFVDGSNLYGTVPPECVELLAANQRLRTLRMVDVALLDSGAVRFAAVLRSNSILEEVDFSGCDIGNVGATALANALEVNASLKVLYLEDNVMTELCVSAFLRALVRNERIERVCLGSVDMPEYWKPRVEINDPEKVFGRLQVEWNSWGVHETQLYLNSVAGAPGRPTAKALRLLWTRWVPVQYVERLLLASSACFVVEVTIGSAHRDPSRVVGAVAALLLRTWTLKKLVVETVVHGDEAKLMLLSAFEDNSTVRIAELYMEVDSYHVAAALADMLQANRTLQSLTIWSQGLTDLALERLARGFKNNDVLLNFSFRDYLSKETVRQMRQLLRRNRCLVNRAAKYALRISSDADSREAFKKLVGRDCLVDTLVEACGKTRAECEQLVEDRAWEIDGHKD